MVEYIRHLEIPPLDQRECIPAYAIQAIVDIIVEKYDPEKIILFGSHAYGSPQPWSDIDLLVVMESGRHPVAVSQEMLRHLPPAMFSIDIVVRTPKTIQRRIALGDTFLKEIISRGQVMYERVN